MSSTPKLLNFTSFKSLDKWYVEYYLNSQTLSSNYDMVSLRSLITPIKRRIKKTEYDGTLPVVSKIVFKTGKIIFRKENKTGMDLLHVKKGDMLVSSINFHQGAIALNETTDFVCSTHYQTFLIDENQVIPEYLIQVLRSSIFINMVAGIKANGIKNESGYDFIGGLEIPLPSKTAQKTLLSKYHDKLHEEQSYINAGDNFQRTLLYDIQSEVTSLKKDYFHHSHTDSIMQLIPFTSTRRWEVGYNLKEGLLDMIYDSFKYQSHSIGTLQKESLFGLSIKASLEQKADISIQNSQSFRLLYLTF